MSCSSDHPFIIKLHFHYVIVVLLCDYPTSEPSAVTFVFVLFFVDFFYFILFLFLFIYLFIYLFIFHVSMSSLC